MRVLVAHPGPAFSVQDVHAGYVEALRELGVNTAEFNLGDRLDFYANALRQVEDGVFRRMLSSNDEVLELATNGLYSALYKFRPDALVVVSGFFVPERLLDLARAHGTKVVILHTESPYEDDRQLALATHADVNVINDPTNLSRFQEIGPALYLPHAYRGLLHHPIGRNPYPDYDFVFAGTGFESRIQFLDEMFSEMSRLHHDGEPQWSVGLAGNWQRLTENDPLRATVVHPIGECMPNEETAKLYRNAKVSLNFYRREANRPELATGWAMGPREVEMAACGLFFIRDPRGEGDEILSMLPTFQSPAEAGQLIAYWLRHDNERERIAEKARGAIAERTFTRNASALLRMIE